MKPNGDRSQFLSVVLLLAGFLILGLVLNFFFSRCDDASALTAEASIPADNPVSPPVEPPAVGERGQFVGGYLYEVVNPDSIGRHHHRLDCGERCRALPASFEVVGVSKNRMLVRTLDEGEHELSSEPCPVGSLIFLALADWPAMRQRYLDDQAARQAAEVERQEVLRLLDAEAAARAQY